MDDPDTTFVTCRTRSYRIDTPKIRTIAQFICARLGVGGEELTVALVGTAGIRRLNREFRGKDKATDVLSFPQRQWRTPAKVRRATKPRPSKASAPPEALGDIVISLPEAERNARGIGQGLDREVCFLMVHGILHLCGHDHMQPAEERRMLAAQRQLMAAIDAGKGGPQWRGIARRRPRRTR